ncbi:MAG: malonyl-CoA synthase [Hyphomicrobiales bacterium]|nr:malonyl-CoA synthase [Hyphomicrobiales bacterium]
MTARNLYDLFRSHFPQDPDALFLEVPDGQSVPYAALDGETGRLAALLDGLGVAAGDRVVVQVDKSPTAVLLYLACLRLGAVYVPLNTAYTADEVAYFLGDAGPRVFVCRPQDAERAQAVAAAAGVAHVLTLAADGGGTLAAGAAGLAPLDVVAERSCDDVAAILYTSGTTGRSKGAMLTLENLASNAQTLHALWGWVPGDVQLHALPIFHVHGLFVALHCALLNGSTTIFLPGFDPARVTGLLPRATVFMGVPTFYTRLLDHPDFGAGACASMRLFLAGSAPLLAETFDAFTARTGHRIVERYGMTETGMITSNPYAGGERVAGTVGYPLPDVIARVADGDGHELPRGETGVLEVKGPNVFKGYWNMPEKTAEEFRRDGFFITGDMATMAEDGRVTIVGRAKDLVISGGYNVYPKEIELLIDEVPGVRESAVVGLPHPDFGEGVTAVVVRDGGAGTEVDEAAILAALDGHLAKFKQPKRVFFVDELPRNTMGKVQKNELRTRYADTYRR